MNYFYTIEIISFVVIVICVFWIFNLRKERDRRKELELKLKHNEEKFRSLFEYSPIFVDAFDNNGKFTLWNKECERVFGWTIEELNSCENSIALFYPEKKDQQRMLDGLHKTGDYTFQEWRPLTKSGNQLITMWAVIPLPNEENLAIGYDITQQRKVQSELNEKAEQLKDAKEKLTRLNTSLEERVALEIEKNRQHQKLMIQQSRHAQMGEIISMIAHQWRHPLNNLSLIIQDAVFQYKTNRFSGDVIKRLNTESSKQIKQMSNTITEFRDFFKPDKESVEFDIIHSLNQAVDIIKPLLETHKIELITELQKDIRMFGYPTELGQSIVNLLSNAKDALVENGITNKSIKLSLRSYENKITIVIKDNAGGISKNIIEKIFDPYFSTKTDKHGTGLGLYIAKIIVEDHMKGKLSVSNDKSGAVFVISFIQEK